MKQALKPSQLMMEKRVELTNCSSPKVELIYGMEKLINVCDLFCMVALAVNENSNIYKEFDIFYMFRNIYKQHL